MSEVLVNAHRMVVTKNFLVFLPRNVDYLGYNGFFLGFFLGERLFFRLFFLRVQFLFQLAFDFLAAQLFLLPFLWNKSVQEIPAVQPQNFLVFLELFQLRVSAELDSIPQQVTRVYMPDIVLEDHVILPFIEILQAVIQNSIFLAVGLLQEDIVFLSCFDDFFMEAVHEFLHIVVPANFFGGWRLLLFLRLHFGDFLLWMRRKMDQGFLLLLFFDGRR